MPEFHLNQPPSLKDAIAEFMLDRQVRGVSAGTLAWHERAMRKWTDFCTIASVSHPTQTTPSILRQYILHLRKAKHNPGGVSNLYRSVRTFLLWYEDEFEPANWVSPTRKIKVGDGDTEALDPLSLDDFAAMVATCQRRSFAGDRDRAILYTLLDTGIRRQELTDLHTTDVDLSSGSVQIRNGKGGKSRTVFLGANSRRTLMQYLRYHPRNHPALWLTDDGKQLSYSGIREIIRRRARQAKITEPGLHSFRRAFALGYLRNGGDVLTLQRLLGHASLDIINRYVKHITADLAAAHRAHGVVDRL